MTKLLVTKYFVNMRTYTSGMIAHRHYKLTWRTQQSYLSSLICISQSPRTYVYLKNYSTDVCCKQPVLILTGSVCCKRGWHWRSLTYTCYMLIRGSARKPKLESELLASRTTKVKKNNWFVAESFHVLSKTHRVEPLFSVPMWPLCRGWTVFDDFFS